MAGKEDKMKRIREEKDKTLEDFMEEVIMGIWALIQFSLWPVKARSSVGGIFENIIRSLMFYGITVGCFWLYCFAHEKEHSFNLLTLMWFLVGGIFLFSLRQWHFSISLKNPVEHKKITGGRFKGQQV